MVLAKTQPSEIAGRGGTSPIGTVSPNTGSAANTNSTYGGGAYASGLNFPPGSAYTVQNTDYQGVVLFNTASAVAVALNSAVGENFTCQIVNLGTGAITLTPTAFTINGVASLALASGVGVTVYFADRQWSAFSGAQYINVTSVNSVAVPNPNFNDSSPAASLNYQNVKWQHLGSQVSAEVPYATLSTVGVVRPDGSTITIDSSATLSTIGYSGSVALAKLTSLGTNGSLTVTDGLITGVVQPT